MSLKWPLMYLILLLPILYVVFRKIKKRHKKPVFVSETNLLTKLPSYTKVRRKRRLLHIAEQSVMTLILVLLVTLAARPQRNAVIYSEQKSRDIVLCIDLSGSMQNFVKPALDVMEDIYKNNPSDRYSIVGFASRGYTVLPLTRDASAIQEKIDMLRKIYGGKEIDDKNYAFRSVVGFGTDIGEGVLTGINRFPNLQTYKSRHLILLSDLVQTGGDFDQSSQKFLDKIGLLPKYRINFYVMRAINEDSQYANNEIVDVGGGTAYDVKQDSNSEATKKIVQSIFSQVLNTEKVGSKNQIDDPSYALIALICAVILWVSLVMLRQRGTV